MKLSRRGKRTKHARRGKHTKRVRKHHTRHIKHRGKQYKRTYRKNNRKYKKLTHGRNLRGGLEFIESEEKYTMNDVPLSYIKKDSKTKKEYLMSAWSYFNITLEKLDNFNNFLKFKVNFYRLDRKGGSNIEKRFEIGFRLNSKTKLLEYYTNGLTGDTKTFSMRMVEASHPLVDIRDVGNTGLYTFNITDTRNKEFFSTLCQKIQEIPTHELTTTQMTTDKFIKIEQEQRGQFIAEQAARDMKKQQDQFAAEAAQANAEAEALATKAINENIFDRCDDNACIQALLKIILKIDIESLIKVIQKQDESSPKVSEAINKFTECVKTHIIKEDPKKYTKESISFALEKFFENVIIYGEVFPLSDEYKYRFNAVSKLLLIYFLTYLICISLNIDCDFNILKVKKDIKGIKLFLSTIQPPTASE